MPVVIAWIGEMLLSIAGQIALTVLVSLGIGFAASKGASGLIDATGIQNAFAGAGQLIQWIGFLGIDKSITIILSAWAGRKIIDASKVHFVSLKSSSSAGSSS